MHPADIKAALEKAGWNQRKIIRSLRFKGKSEAMVSRAIAGKERALAVEARISEITGIPLQKLWPQWYPSTGRKAA